MAASRSEGTRATIWASVRSSASRFEVQGPRSTSVRPHHSRPPSLPLASALAVLLAIVALVSALRFHRRRGSGPTPGSLEALITTPDLSLLGQAMQMHLMERVAADGSSPFLATRTVERMLFAAMEDVLADVDSGLLPPRAPRPPRATFTLTLAGFASAVSDRENTLDVLREDEDGDEDDDEEGVVRGGERD